MFSITWTSVVILLSCTVRSNTGSANTQPAQDTSIIAEWSRPTVIGDGKVQESFSFRPQGSFTTSTGTFLMQFNSVRAEAAPDGAYEVYLSGRPISQNDLQPNSPFFLGVLDTYAATGATGGKPIYMDVSGAVKKTGPTVPQGLEVTLLFRGNKLPNGTESREAGKLSVESVALLRVR